MAARDQNSLTGAEQQALVLIRELRRQLIAGEIPIELKNPARLVHHLITLYHGHTQLRISKLAPELGVTLRTLERSFHEMFRKSMKDYQLETRLQFAQYLLSSNPDLKMSVVAKRLGYDDPNSFERFFRDHAHNSPHAWSEAEQARLTEDGSGKRDSKG